MTASSTIDLLTALWLGFLGSCVGSFLNVVAYRMPRGMSVIWKPSHCPKCSHPIRFYDNVPVLGWLWLRGRCRDCGEQISPRYAIVEFFMGLAFFVLAYVELFSGGANLPDGPITELSGATDIVWQPQWEVIGIYAFHCFVLSVLMCLVLMDRDESFLPKRIGLCLPFCILFRGAWWLYRPTKPIVQESEYFGLVAVLVVCLVATFTKAGRVTLHHIYFIFALSCIGIATQLTVAITALVLCAALIPVASLQKIPGSQHLRHFIMPCVWLGGMLQIAFWQQIANRCSI